MRLPDSKRVLQTQHVRIPDRWEKSCIAVFYDLAFFLAHLSRRLKGKLIVYRSIRRPSVSPGSRKDTC